ncbi:MULTISPECIES: Bro-N domain-containing protein [unclassified Acinetobacter]|uniref:BRO-N domain-containing protein n=1 Tax=unclassified Acinetobacter TaxID=196816 RepID=UPI002935149D|nr:MULTISPECIES: BRO family protein [unclassified Acinetobacter]WOE32965.1 BRO family protein [Acinetobacter sp. SAAs470]WOE38442.1 BRO family protein [Acinetobacter sp. SAAs474]
MMNPSIFNFNNHGVRIVYGANGEPLFCLTDVCSVLSVDRSSRLLRELDSKGMADCHILTNGGTQKVKFINEPNLYRIIFRSNKLEALNFQDWVFNEVLPVIRKTGSYSPTARQTAFDELNRICMEENLSKDKGTFHSHGMHKRKREKHLNAKRIQACKANIQLTFEGIHND